MDTRRSPRTKTQKEMVKKKMRDKIIQELHDIEKNKNIKILYACEAGSRVWGFASKDSDFDIRFIYIHKKPWYLSLNEKQKNTIEKFSNNKLFDFAGWECRKALNLFAKSNPPLIEHLYSPVVYMGGELTFRDRLILLLNEYYSSTACMYHYFHMAQGNLREYLKGDKVWLKKYLYAIRPLLSCIWIENYGDRRVPSDINKLLYLLPTDKLKQEVAKLIERKKNGDELSMGPKIPRLHAWIESQLKRLEEFKQSGGFKSPDDKKTNKDKLNIFFREQLELMWFRG